MRSSLLRPSPPGHYSQAAGARRCVPLRWPSARALPPRPEAPGDAFPSAGPPPGHFPQGRRCPEALFPPPALLQYSPSGPEGGRSGPKGTPQKAGHGRCGHPERPVRARSSFPGGLSGMMWDSRRGPGRTRRFVLDLPPVAGQNEHKNNLLEFVLDLPPVVGENEHKDASPESVLGLPLALGDRTESLLIEAPGRVSSLGDPAGGEELPRCEDSRQGEQARGPGRWSCMAPGRGSGEVDQARGDGR